MKGNQVTLVGYVGTDLKLSYSTSGTKRVAMRIGTHFLSKNEEGKKKNKTTWHNVVAWGHAAIYAERSFVKGSHILVQGSIEYRTWVDPAGHKHYLTHINGDSLINLDR